VIHTTGSKPSSSPGALRPCGRTRMRRYLNPHFVAAWQGRDHKTAPQGGQRGAWRETGLSVQTSIVANRSVLPPSRGQIVAGGDRAGRAIAVESIWFSPWILGRGDVSPCQASFARFIWCAIDTAPSYRNCSRIQRQSLAMRSGAGALQRFNWHPAQGGGA
jgi:hypothetical protein